MQLKILTTHYYMISRLLKTIVFDLNQVYGICRCNQAYGAVLVQEVKHRHVLAIEITSVSKLSGMKDDMAARWFSYLYLVLLRN